MLRADAETHAVPPVHRSVGPQLPDQRPRLYRQVTLPALRRGAGATDTVGP